MISQPSVSVIGDRGDRQFGTGSQHKCEAGCFRVPREKDDGG